MKKTVFLASALLFSISTQAQILDALKSTVKDKTGVDLTTPSKTTTTTSSSTKKSTANLNGLSSDQIASGLKEALNLGVTEGIQKLSATDGFYKNAAVKILMPKELRAIDTKLRALGLGSLADQGVKSLNRAAEDAVSEAAPIFANAITSMSISDASNVLLSSDNAATSYLQNKTQTQLFSAFEPKVQASLGKVGADVVWNNLISKYNKLTGQSVTTDIEEYVTTETINGVFKMVAEKEGDLRNNPVTRTTGTLQKVFGVLDK
ncbi:DUF4197 domain-containing protein [Chryseobacterium sp. CT-SW4]|uniref:DUF4197 domain-containing protein n=1 Tax=Chryseobacterium sp. SW-1 TaxID=3157343 RepID=UPI003B0175DE